MEWPRVDRNRWTVHIDRARVMGRDKGTTKTSVARDIECCPRAVALLKRQFALTGLKGENVFGFDTGERYPNIRTAEDRWPYTHKRLGIRYREPYQARHTSVTWNLMIEKPLLWVAGQHGHSVAVMLKTYAKWLKGSTLEDIDAIRRAMGFNELGVQTWQRNG